MASVSCLQFARVLRGVYFIYA